MTIPERPQAPYATPPFDAGFASEESRVRTRARHGVHSVVPAQPRSLGESLCERSDRLEAKIRLAERLMSVLGPRDPDRRLLGSALLRRDEALLEAILRRAMSRGR